MAHINISRSHTLGVAGARHAAEEVARQLVHEYGVTYAWRGNTLHVQGAGVQGELVASETDVRITVSLGLLVRPLRSYITSEIERTLDEYV